ncbi:MAG TPA: hypothetical protein VGX25_06365 [Actinophytocola sp.]|uniref:hypothetical protein n=1 Tax=Actinophytocola sp. TaxID=1872138 RepID=UPI002DDDBB46|nr:hypothetical protein [Actinophytocola sp.]HEV2779010.1 hypothetical protein [Actinophytocola sp.]
MTSYAGLGFDPTPGEPSAVENALTQLADGGGKLEMLMGTIESDLDLSDGWDGAAADEFHDNLDDIPRALNSGAQSMGYVADALVAWTGQLADNKRQTEILDKLALELKQQLREAVAELNQAKTALESARGANRASAQAAFDRAAVHAVSVNDQLDAVIQQARTLQDKHLAQAEATAIKIAEASNSDTFEPTGKVDQVVGTVGSVLGEISVWTGRAAFVAGLLAGGPAGLAVAGALYGATVASGLTGTAAKLYAKDAGVHSLQGTNTLGLIADGALSLAGPTSTGTRQLLKALKAGGPKRVLNVLKDVEPKTVGKTLGKGLKEAIEGGQIAKAIQALREASDAKTVREAVENLGKIQAEELAKRDAIDKALAGAGHAGSSAVDAAELLDKAAGGDGTPDWLNIPGKLPDLPGAAGEAADHFSKKALEKIEGTK